MEMILNAGESLSISAEAVNDQIRFVITAFSPKTKPGPKSLPKSEAKSLDFHSAILKAVKRGPMTSEGIRDVVGGTPENKNALSWALVELQNAGVRRGKNIPKTGPLKKLPDGRYALRK